MTSSIAEAELSKLLEYLQQTRNYLPKLENRQHVTELCQQRMATVKSNSVNRYIDFLEVHPEEFTKLFDLLTGNKRKFFHDESLWDFFKTKLKPNIDLRDGKMQYRCWSIGCGTGHEAYSLAIVLCETLGQEFFLERVKIFATDLSEQNLQHARQATFTNEELSSVSEEWKRKYFTPVGTNWVFRNDLRRALIFGKHNLLKDAAISRIDLVICRQVMIYENLENQRRLLSRLKFALKENGLLVLGSCESMPAQSGFAEIDPINKVFGRITNRYIRTTQTGDAKDEDIQLEPKIRLYDAAYDSSPIAQLILDNTGALAIANSRARLTFQLVTQDFGRPFQDLEVSYRPVELRSLIDKASRENRVVTASRVSRHSTSGKAQLFDVYVEPLRADDMIIGFGIQFCDATESYELQDELGTVNQQLQTANEELQSAHEELETTNEELQSTNEELETTNEELQSTNEELETMNEELECTNAELQMANAEQQTLASVVEKTNSFLHSILSSMRSGVIVVDSNSRVLVWNDYCRDLWGLHEGEVVGQSLFDLDIGLPVDSLRNPLRSFMQLKKEYDEIKCEAVNRRGRKIQCTIHLTPLVASNSAGSVLLIDDHPVEN